MSSEEKPSASIERLEIFIKSLELPKILSTDLTNPKSVRELNKFLHVTNLIHVPKSIMRALDELERKLNKD